MLRRLFSWLTILFAFQHGNPGEAMWMAAIELEDREGFNKK